MLSGCRKARLAGFKGSCLDCPFPVCAYDTPPQIPVTPRKIKKLARIGLTGTEISKHTRTPLEIVLEVLQDV